jgi:hypothetical protein
MKSIHLPNGVLQGCGNCLYDVLNKLPLNITLGKVESEKYPVFNDHLPFLESGPLAPFFKDSILLFDRLYADYSMFAMLTIHSFLFCIRCKTTCTFKIIEQFVKSRKKEAVLTFKVTAAQRKFIKANNLPEEITLRAIKVILPTGETEVLITNLFDSKEYPKECFKELYFFRWNVEVGFNVLKTFLGIEKFSSDKLQFILQDFYAHVFLYALCEMLKKEEDRKLQSDATKSSQKYQYQIGIAHQITAIQTHLFELLGSEQLSIPRIYTLLEKWFRTQLSPIRPNRSYPRPIRRDSQRLVHHITKKRHHS